MHLLYLERFRGPPLTPNGYAFCLAPAMFHVEADALPAAWRAWLAALGAPSDAASNVLQTGPCCVSHGPVRTSSRSTQPPAHGSGAHPVVAEEACSTTSKPSADRSPQPQSRAFSGPRVSRSAPRPPKKSGSASLPKHKPRSTRSRAAHSASVRGKFTHRWRLPCRETRHERCLCRVGGGRIRSPR